MTPSEPVPLPADDDLSHLSPSTRLLKELGVELSRKHHSVLLHLVYEIRKTDVRRFEENVRMVSRTYALSPTAAQQLVNRVQKVLDDLNK